MARLIHWSRERRELVKGWDQSKLVLRRTRHGGWSIRHSRSLGLADITVTVFTTATRFLHRLAAAQRSRDREGLGYDKQQAKGDRYELFHDAV